MLGAVVAVGIAPTVAAAQESPEPTVVRGTGTMPPDAILAAVRLGELTERLSEIEARLTGVQREEDQARVELGTIEQRLVESKAEADDLVARIRTRAARVYTRGGSGPLAPLSIDSRQDLQSGRSYTVAVTSVDDRLVDQLDRLRQALERDRQQRLDTIAALEDSRVQLQADRARIDLLRVQEQMLIDTWGAVTVMGRSEMTPGQIADFYSSTAIRHRLPEGLVMTDLARLYVEEGELAGVRGDIAFAQSMIETGSFTEFHGYNFSGIGVCDSCTGGYLFDAARDGVRAQMQLLRSYADPTSRAADLPVPLSPVLYGTDPVDSARRFDTFFLKGAAPVWNEMGGGNWATDPVYAGKVLRMYARMLAHAAGSA